MVSRTFQSSWFDKWKWLHYSAPLDVAFCHTCVTAIKTGKMKVSGNVPDSTFLSGGFSNWKDGSRCFNNHGCTKLLLRLWSHYPNYRRCRGNAVISTCCIKARQPAVHSEGGTKYSFLGETGYSFSWRWG